MKTIKAVASFCVLLLASCGGASIDEKCEVTGIVTGEPVCYVSFDDVMKNGDYDGQIVYITGYLSGGRVAT